MVGAYLHTVSGRHHPAPMEQCRPTQLQARCCDHQRRHPRPRMRHYLGASNDPIFVVDRTSTKYIRHNCRGPASHCNFRAKYNFDVSVGNLITVSRKVISLKFHFHTSMPVTTMYLIRDTITGVLCLKQTCISPYYSIVIAMTY